MLWNDDLEVMINLKYDAYTCSDLVWVVKIEKFSLGVKILT